MSASRRALRRIAARRRNHGGSQPALEPDALRDLVAAAQARERGGREELIEAVAPLIGSVARIYRNEDAGGTFGERLADPIAEDAYERIPAKVDSDRLRTLLQALDARERTIVSAHFGLDGPERSLRQVGATLGVSGERVRQVERVALEKLRVAALTGAVDNSRPTPCKAGEHRTTKHEMNSDRQDPSPPATGGRPERRISLRSAGAGRPSPLPR